MSMGPLGMIAGATGSSHSQQERPKTDQGNEMKHESERKEKQPESADERKSKDPAGQSGGQLDITG